MADAVDVDLAEILDLEGQVEERCQMRGRPRRRRQDLLGAMIEYRGRGDCWPNGSDWERAISEHPARRTYVRHFGSWQLAIEAAERERRRLMQTTQRETAGGTSTRR